MAKLEMGQKLPEFTYDTPFERGLSMSRTAEAVQGKTALVFLRYYGCTLCQLDLRDYAKSIEQVKAAGGQLLVVLQSDPDALADQLKEHPLPYPIVCDPEQKLYKQFEIRPAASKLGMADPKTVAKIMRARKEGLQHGAYEGEELQLPACFVVDREMNLTYVHDGKSAADVPNAGELTALL